MKYTIIKTRTERHEAVVEAESEDQAWDLLNEEDIEFEFIGNDDEFEITENN